eukprot:6214476-Pleurochrysis_carterae.AAC.3
MRQTGVCCSADRHAPLTYLGAWAASFGALKPRRRDTFATRATNASEGNARDKRIRGKAKAVQREFVVSLKYEHQKFSAR